MSEELLFMKMILLTQLQIFYLWRDKTINSELEIFMAHSPYHTGFEMQ